MHQTAELFRSHPASTPVPRQHPESGKTETSVSGSTPRDENAGGVFRSSWSPPKGDVACWAFSPSRELRGLGIAADPVEIEWPFSPVSVQLSLDLSFPGVL